MLFAMRALFRQSTRLLPASFPRPAYRRLMSLAAHSFYYYFHFRRLRIDFIIYLSFHASYFSVSLRFTYFRIKDRYTYSCSIPHLPHDFSRTRLLPMPRYATNAAIIDRDLYTRFSAAFQAPFWWAARRRRQQMDHEISYLDLLLLALISLLHFILSLWFSYNIANWPKMPDFWLYLG